MQQCIFAPLRTHISTLSFVTAHANMYTETAITALHPMPVFTCSSSSQFALLVAVFHQSSRCSAQCDCSILFQSQSKPQLIYMLSFVAPNQKQSVICSALLTHCFSSFCSTITLSFEPKVLFGVGNECFREHLQQCYSV